MTLDDFLRHCAQDCVDGGSGHTGWEQLRDEREAMAEERKRLTRQPNLPCPQCGFDLLPSHVDARPCLCDWGVHRPTILLLTRERDEARAALAREADRLLSGEAYRALTRERDEAREQQSKWEELQGYWQQRAEQAERERDEFAREIERLQATGTVTRRGES